MSVRLNKRLVELGLAPSRRKADELISSGGVNVNGEVVASLGQTVSETDTITLYGRQGQERPDIYIAFNKPRGYVCTHRVQSNRQKTIFDLLPLNFAGLKIAGRLDRDSQGLMILSSNGEFIQKITHPSQSKVKTYIVHLDKPLSQLDQRATTEGVRLKDGVSKFDAIRSIKPHIVRVELHEGRNRQIRRSFEALGYKVRQLERIKIGSLELGILGPGQHRFIKPNEVSGA